MSAPTVGVVIPCFNDEPAHLLQAVTSALGQDMPVRVAVVDDGSTNPETIAAIDTLPDAVTVLRGPNQGVSAARNRGIAALATTYLLPLDADDWVTAGFVRACVAVLDAGARIACADTSHEDEPGWFSRAPDAVTLADMVDTNLVGSASMFRHDDWQRVGGYDEGLRIGSEDYEFWVRLLGLGGEARRVVGEVFHHRIRSGSRSSVQAARFDESRRETRAAMARNTPGIAGPALDRVDELLREVARLEADNRWWWRRFGFVRRTARLGRSVLTR